ncbi:MAG: hypothetical protein ACK5Q5_14270 [Planctomycetaceae bacterium]
MGIGLDLGATHFRTLRRDQHQLIARKTPTAYTAVQASADHAHLLQRAHLQAAPADHALLVAGTEAELVAMTMNQPLVPLLMDGRLPANDPIARQVAAERVASILEMHADQPVPICTAVLPGDAPQGEPTREFFRQLISLHGCRPRFISATQAIALAELGNSSFAGVILSFGATGASLALMERGEIQAFVDVPCGGDWIDRRLAQELRQFTFDRDGHRYLDTVAVSRWKQAPDRSLAADINTDNQLLRKTYAEVLTALLARFRRTVIREGVNGPRKTPLSLICHGGCTQISGFLPQWEQFWKQAEIDLVVAPARLARDDQWTIARGCLIHSELAHDAQNNRRAA